LRYSTPDAFLRVEKTRKEVHSLLQRLAEQPHFREAFIWDTCQRIEFYGWVRGPESPARRAVAAARITQDLFGAGRQGLEVNRLEGCQLWHHLMRTACGLNSRLPGDLDVTAQLETAVHFAQSAGAAGGRAATLLERVLRVADDVGRATEWGAFRAGYCRAALGQLRDPQQVSWDRCTHVVIGGSTTSRSIINTLVDVYQVPQPQITLVYRGHHGQWKLLRAALGDGRRLRVQAYTDAEILQAVAAADVVYFGLDVAGPVLEPAAINRLRDFRRRPLLLVDFNSLGSVGCSSPAPGITLCSAPQLDAAVTRYADTLRRQPEFCRAAQAADRWIRSRGLARVSRLAIA
jgi:glutamyl-tRNA reductase